MGAGGGRGGLQGGGTRVQRQASFASRSVHRRSARSIWRSALSVVARRIFFYKADCQIRTANLAFIGIAPQNSCIGRGLDQPAHRESTIGEREH